MIIPATLDDAMAQWKDLGLPVLGNLDRRNREVAADILNPEKSRRYAPRSGLTFCNVFVQDFTRLLDCWIPHTYDVKTGEPVQPGTEGADELQANEFPAWMEAHGERRGWKKVGSEKEARDLYERLGLVVVFCWVNPKGPGHVGVMVDDGFAQAGAVCQRRAKLNWCLSPTSQARTLWFAHA